jgi:hypothetical protein
MSRIEQLRANSDHPSAVGLRSASAPWAAKHVERGQLQRLLDPHPALNEELERGPVPEPIDLLAQEPGVWAGCWPVAERWLVSVEPPDSM